MSLTICYQYAITGTREELLDIVEHLRAADQEYSEQFPDRSDDELDLVKQNEMAKQRQEEHGDEPDPEASTRALLDSLPEPAGDKLCKHLGCKMPEQSIGNWGELPLELSTAADGSLYFKLDMWFPWGAPHGLIEVLESSYKTVRVYWNDNGETNDTDHLYFTEEELEATVLPPMKEEWEETQARSGLPTILVDFDALINRLQTRIELEAKGEDEDFIFEHQLELSKPVPGVEEALDRMNQVANVFIFNDFWHGDDCAGWLKENMRKWSYNLILRTFGAWHEPPLQADFHITYTHGDGDARVYLVQHAGQHISTEGERFDSWAEVATYIESCVGETENASER